MDIPSRLGQLRVKDPPAATSPRDLPSELKSPEEEDKEERVERHKPIGTTPSSATQIKYLLPKIVIHPSIEDRIKAGFQESDDYILFPDSPTPQGPRTFAEVTMGARTRGRRVAQNDYEPPSTRPQALGQVGTFQVITKKSNKWTSLHYSMAEITSASASTSDFEVEESGSPGLSRRSSLNPTAPEFELQSQSYPHDLRHNTLSPCSSDSHNEERYKGKGIAFGKEQTFQIGATSADQATSVSTHSPEHGFGVGTLTHKHKENSANVYQDDATYLKNTRGMLKNEGKVQYYHQESHSSTNNDRQSWDPTLIFNTDLDLTPRFTQSSLQTSISLSSVSIPGISLRTSYPFVPYSTKQSQNETYQTMAHRSNSIAPKHILKPGEDAFDSLEWDPELPTVASPDSSPEPVPIKPQPVAYTTVGSLVKQNNVPQFSAPNRIQREGAKRRPLISLLSGPRQYDSVLQPRGQPQPLSMASSMHYAQQIGRSPANLPVPSFINSARFPRSASIKNMPKGLEEATLMRQFLGNEPRELAGNVNEATGSFGLPRKYSSSAGIPSRQLFSVTELIEEEEEHIQSNSAPSLVQGLEKMQTLQRLAKFTNPMQELARSRLAEFSLLKSQTSEQTVANRTTMSAQEILLDSQIGMSSKTSVTNSEGELNRGFVFPPLGFAHTLEMQANTVASCTGSTLPQTTSAAVRPGYPEPLTAGPPGRQRQYNTSSSQPPTNHQEIWSPCYASQLHNPYSNGAVSSPWNNQYTGQHATQSALFQSHAGNVKSKLVDTIDPNSLSKYYCAGYPGDMTGQYQPISEENARLMVEGPFKNLPKEVRHARRDEATNELYEVGQRRYNLMTADDYMKELEDAKRYQNEKQTNPFGVIGPPKKKMLPPIEPKPFTDEDIKKKPISKLVHPALESGWGALAGYAASEVPGSNSDLSGLVRSPDWQIDPVGDGNITLFGEDWGAPPKGSAALCWDH